MNEANRILRRQCANALRVLAMDAVQAANSGHPGMPMGMADIAQVLWADHLRHNPGNPLWADRDRFVDLTFGPLANESYRPVGSSFPKR